LDLCHCQIPMLRLGGSGGLYLRSSLICQLVALS
jgi:hypothetical protein